MNVLELAKKSIEHRAAPEPIPAPKPSWDYRIRDDPAERAEYPQYNGKPCVTTPNAFRMEETEDLDSLFELPPLRASRRRWH